jgi:hypothetical protein
MKPEDKAVVQQALDALGNITNFERLEKARAALRQLLEQPEPVQDGWILVPVTPTNDMTSAMADALEDPENERSSWDLAENMWHAMLPKVPTPPAQPADYDRSIHGNPDARAWAKFFVATAKEQKWCIDDIDEGLMIGWFANAMMAMHDHVKREEKGGA